MRVAVRWRLGAVTGFVLIVVACSDDPGGPDDGVARAVVVEDGVPADLVAVRPWVEEATTELLQDLRWTLLESEYAESMPELGFGHSLVGTSTGTLIHMTLVNDTGTFAPFCWGAVGPTDPGDPFYATRNHCGQLTVPERGVYLVTSYYTMQSHTTAEDRHPFEYPAVGAPGVFIADPNPLLEWRVTASTGRTMAQVEFASMLSFRATAGDTLDLSHLARASGFVDHVTMSAADTLHLEFPGLGVENSPLTVGLTVDAADRACGQVRRGDRTLAVVAGTYPVLTFSW